MPVSASQHRISSGIYQNKQRDNIKNNISLRQAIAENNPLTSGEICQFKKNISQAINYHEEPYEQLSYHRAPSQSVIVPALLLLSQIRLTSHLSDKPYFISDRDISLLSSDNTIHSDNSDSGFNALLNPIADALYKTGEMISRYDPLRFPGANAVPLSVASPESVNTPDNHFLSEDITKKTNELISTITNGKESAAIREMVDELNSIAIEAEKEFPSEPPEYQNIYHLIYLIDKSKKIIDKFEIKYGQEYLCETLRLQREYYIEMANNISDDESQLEFQEYIEALPTLTFTPDSRGGTFPSVESQIADKLGKSVFGFDDQQGNTSAYGSQYDAYKSLLTSLLAEKNIGSIDNLPDGWDKGDEDIRLVNILFRDLELNLNSKGWKYLVTSVKMFGQSYRDALSKDNTLTAKELQKKLLHSYSSSDQFHLLKYAFKQPIEIKYNQQPDSSRFSKLLDLFASVQCITESMHLGHQPTGRNNISGHYHKPIRDSLDHHFRIKADSSDHHHKPRIDTHHIRSYQQCKSAGNLKPEYNRNTHELTLYPTSGRNKKLKENDLKMKKILSENERVDKIKFRSIPSLRNEKNHSSISKEVKNKITPDMYVKNKHEYPLSLPDDLGLIHDTHGNKYLRVNDKIAKIQHIKYPPNIYNRYVIEGKENKNLYLRYRKDEKFHPESFNERLNVDKTIDFGEIISNVESLTSDERHALREYGRTGPNDINSFIAKGLSENYQTTNLTAPMVQTIDNIQHALDKIAPYRGTVYKYIMINKKEFDSFKKGQLFISKTFLSCTKNEKVANRGIDSLIHSLSPSDTYNFADTPRVIMYEFNIKKSGHSLEWFTEKFYEEEVLIERNNYFIIKDICSETYKVTLDETGSLILSNEEKTLAKNIAF